MRPLDRILAGFVPGSATVPGLSASTCRGFLERLRAQAPWTVIAGLYGSAFLVLVTPPLTIGRWRFASALPDADLDAHANALTRHRSYLIRQAACMVKATAGMAWGADPEVRRALGQLPYPPDPGTWRRS